MSRSGVVYLSCICPDPFGSARIQISDLDIFPTDKFVYLIATDESL